MKNQRSTATPTRMLTAIISAFLVALLVAGLTPAGAIPKGGVDGPRVPPTTSPPTAPPTSSDPRPPVVNAPGLPRFKVEAVSFTAVDESGFDWAGSDEPMFVFSSDSAGVTRTSRSREYGNVDSGDTRSLFNKCVIHSCRQGFTVDTTLMVQLFEMDGGSRESVRQKVEALALAAELATLAATGSEVSIPDWVIDALVDLFSDDLMGSKTLRYSPKSLAKTMRVGDSRIDTHRLGGHSGDLPFEVAGGPDYDLRLKVTRLTNKPIFRHQVLR